MEDSLLPARKTNIPKRKIVAVIPARDEADVVGAAVASLLRQALPEPIEIVLVDDASQDGTAEAALRQATDAGQSERLTVIRGRPLPKGWTGKLWAVSQGIRQARLSQPDYFLLTDADIRHAPETIANLLAVAEEGSYDLASLMVQLATGSVAEKLLIPAFVYFFLQLYPPRAISDRHSKIAGAAGGCMLIHADTLRRVGGVEAIRGDIIDDCALASLVKRNGGAVWLGLCPETISLRSYGSFGEVERMIARSAFKQLRHSSLLLGLTLLGLLVTYIIPPLLLLSGRKQKVALGIAAYALMSRSYLPAVRLYRQPMVSALSLPLVALFYAGATVHSALAYWTGTGGQWKGRLQDRPS